MGITKLYAGVEGDPLNSSGPQIRDTVNQLIETHINSLKTLPTAVNAQTDTIYNVIGFYANTQLGGGRFIWNSTINKSTHNGGTIIAPEAISTWNGTQADIATLLNWTGAGSGCWMRIDLQGFVVPDMFGAVGNGTTNDALAVTRATTVSSNTQGILKGTSLTYGVSGNITLPSWIWIDGLKLKQLTPNSISRRTLFQANGQFCRLENVIVDRNGDGSGGTLSDAAGIWVNDCPSLFMNNVEVFGNDFGSGIAVIRCDNARINNIYVHDITGGTASSPVITDDTIHGLLVQGGTGVTVDNPRIKNLLNRWTGQSALNRFSRGIAVGGAKQFSISAPIVDNVDQGIDITGGDNPEFFEVNGGIVSNCYTWGAKCANSVQNGVFTGVIAYRCGQAGFVASAPSVIMTDITQNITYTGCRSIQTGFGGVWTSLTNVAGFRVVNTGTYPSHPRSIKYVGCSADGNGGVMEYGFFSDSTLGTTDGEQWVEVIHCDVQGATVKNYFGIQTGYADRRRTSTQSIGNSVWTDVDYTMSTDYMGATSGTPTTTLNATRCGLYTINAGVVWAGSNAGTRAIRILINGVEQLGSTIRLPAVTPNEFNIATSTTVAIATSGAAIKVQVLQDSGTSLSLNGAALRISLISAGYGG